MARHILQSPSQTIRVHFLPNEVDLVIEYEQQCLWLESPFSEDELKISEPEWRLRYSVDCDKDRGRAIWKELVQQGYTLVQE